MMKQNLHKMQFMNESEFHNAETGLKIINRTDKFRPPFETSKEEALKKLKLRIAENKTKVEVRKTNTIQLMYWAASVAAALLLALGIWGVWLQAPTTSIITAMGQHTDFQLPDGSIVSVNADSKITYSKSDFTKTRKLKLEGEAFFKVKKGSTFTVNTPLGNVKVLGTSFNVYAREKNFKVSCLTGKVRVTSGSNEVIITPGESAILENASLVKMLEKNIQNIGQWQSGEFNFESSSLNMVFKEIERQYNVKFVRPDLNEKFFTGSFTNKNLTDALDIVCIPMGLTYEIGNGSISIREKKD